MLVSDRFGKFQRTFAHVFLSKRRFFTTIYLVIQTSFRLPINQQRLPCDVNDCLAYYVWCFHGAIITQTAYLNAYFSIAPWASNPMTIKIHASLGRLINASLTILTPLMHASNRCGQSNPHRGALHSITIARLRGCSVCMWGYPRCAIYCRKFQSDASFREVTILTRDPYGSNSPVTPSHTVTRHDRSIVSLENYQILASVCSGM